MKSFAAAALIGLVFCGTAQAATYIDAPALRKTTGLPVTTGPASIQAGRAAISRFTRREVRLQGSGGFELDRCWRRARTVGCVVYEWGIPNDVGAFDGLERFDMTYTMRARHVGGGWVVWSPMIDFG